MLSLGRNPGEYVMIGDDIVIQVVSMDGELRLAIDAPKTLPIQRGEVYEQNHDTPKCIREKYIKHKKNASHSHRGGIVPNSVQITIH